MSKTIHRRHFMAGLGVSVGTGLIAAPSIVRAAAEPIVIRAGALKLIHSIAPYFYDQFVPAGYKVEVVPFETPTECKSAVVTKSVDFGAFGIAAAILGAAAGEPVVVIASTCNRGMAIISKKDSGINALKDLKGKRVAVFPGTTQEVFFLERLKMEGMTIKDVEPVRVSFSEMHISLARGDIDAYVGAEPGPGVSLSSGIGQLVEYPYSTPMGSPQHGVRHPCRPDQGEARPRQGHARHSSARDRICRRPTRRRWWRWPLRSSGRRRRRSRPRCRMSS